MDDLEYLLSYGRLGDFWPLPVSPAAAIAPRRPGSGAHPSRPGNRRGLAGGDAASRRIFAEHVGGATAAPADAGRRGDGSPAVWRRPAGTIRASGGLSQELGLAGLEVLDAEVLFDAEHARCSLQMRGEECDVRAVRQHSVRAIFRCTLSLADLHIRSVVVHAAGGTRTVAARRVAAAAATVRVAARGGGWWHSVARASREGGPGVFRGVAREDRRAPRDAAVTWWQKLWDGRAQLYQQWPVNPVGSSATPAMAGQEGSNAVGRQTKSRRCRFNKDSNSRRRTT